MKEEEGFKKKIKLINWDDFLLLRKESKIKEALERLYELCENNNGLALVQLGRAYHLGLYGLKQSKYLSIKYLQQSNHPIAKYYLYIYHKYKRTDIANNHFFLQAFFYLDDKRPHDYSKEQCTKQAIALFKKTAETCKIFEAYNHLAQIDTRHRVSHLKMGASLGDEQCQWDLAKYYEAKQQFNKSWPYIKKYYKQYPDKRTKHAIYDDLEKYENTERICKYIWWARTRGDPENYWRIFPKDIVKIIIQLIWKTKNDDIWNYTY